MGNRDEAPRSPSIVERSLDDAIEIRRGDLLLSRLPREVGPTHTLLDVAAACAVRVARDRDIAVLGFAAGGIVAPLRALGARGHIDAVDISEDGLDVFLEVSGKWRGDVVFERDEASAWLRRQPASRFGAIIEDLSVEEGDGMQKPWESVVAIPPLAREAIASDGVVITNVLPWPGTSWEALLGNIAAPFATSLIVESADYENRLLVCADELPRPSLLQRELRCLLERIGSRQLARFAVREGLR